MKKKQLKELPSITGKVHNEAHFEYVSNVVKGMKKTRAFELAYPDKYQKLKDGGDARFFEANLRRSINTMDKNPIVEKMYNAQDKMLYTDFIHKKHKLLNRMYEQGMDDDLDVRDQQSATKIFMQFVPNIQRDLNINVDVNISREDDHRKMLIERKKALHEIANSNVIDVEVEDNEEKK